MLGKKEREKGIFIYHIVLLFCLLSKLDLGFYCFTEKALAQIQRDAKEVHFPLSRAQILKIERIFRVICTTQF